MIKKLRIKFICINMATVVVMLCAIFSLFYISKTNNMENESLRSMQMAMDQPRMMEGPVMDNHLPYIIIQVNEGKTIEKVDSGAYTITNQSALEEIVSEVMNSNKTYDVISRYSMRYLKQDRMNAHFIILSDISDEINTLNSILRVCILIGIFSFLAFLVISILLSKWAIQPVEEAWNQQRQFVSDASHELKTPLAVICTNSDLLSSNEYSDEEKNQFISNIQTVSRHMKVLVEQMLELARADNGTIKSTMEEVDVYPVVSEVALTMEALLFEKGHEITLDLCEDVKVIANREKLGQVVEILLDNAGKYASENGKISISLKKFKHHCVFYVANEGSPIPKTELNNLFKRFYRLDSARQRDGSFGLGLSIAYQFVNDFKGKIWADSKDGINTFYVQLPLN